MSSFERHAWRGTKVVRVSVLPDGIASTKTNPLRDGAILFLSFRKLLLRAEGFVGLWTSNFVSQLVKTDTAEWYSQAS